MFILGVIWSYFIIVLIIIIIIIFLYVIIIMLINARMVLAMHLTSVTFNLPLMSAKTDVLEGIR